MLLMPALFLFSPVRVTESHRRVLFFLVWITLVILIGLRNEVGGDWDRYLDSAYGIDKYQAFDIMHFFKGDIAYRAIHWVSVNYLYGIYSTNFICAVFFVSGLARFCRFMPIPWLALLISVPYLIIIVSMGYTRQSVAIGFLMWGLVDLINGKKYKYYMFIAIGSLFHLSLLVMLFLAMPISHGNFNKKMVIKWIVVLLLTSFFVYTALGEQIDHMIFYYITTPYHHSVGSVFRVGMGSLAGVIYLIYRDNFKSVYYDYKLWFVFSIISIILLPAAFVLSTFVDRIAIYFIPLQLVVFSRVPTLIESVYYRTIFVIFVIFLYAFSLFVWLNFGLFSNHWLDYGSILF